MIIAAVDDEKIALEALCSAIGKCEPDADIVSFRLASEAYEYIKDNEVDVAFLDIEMRDKSGIELAKELKFVRPNLNIIFATGYDSFFGEAFAMHASGYLLKPITVDKVRKELDNLRYPVENKDSGRRVKFHCFGNFEVYIDGTPAKFKYSKTKEALAYLVDRSGSLCSNNEIIVALWEDDSHASYLKNIKRDMFDVFSSVGLGDVLIKQRNQIGINRELVDCDYYDMQAGTAYALNSYRGEYMEQYSWAELTRGMLEI